MNRFMQAAYDEATASFDEGGVPVGSVLVHDGEIVSAGRNRQEQKGSNLLHAENDALESAGRRGRRFFRNCELYTTLSPCPMCAGAVLFYEIPKMIIGDATNYPGEVEWLRSRGVDVVVEDSAECIALLQRFMTEKSDLWAKVTAD
ncbi:MAG: nucleoside deaminase [Alphaproteobacteria bacterium]|nr:nucleoside deaminase [Alphaproteobacteria bacterium]